MIHTTILFETTDIYFHHIIESGLVKKKKKKMSTRSRETKKFKFNCKLNQKF